jgi:hypothetical protein
MRAASSGRKIGIDLYTPVLLINTTATVVAVALLGWPVRPAIFGALAAGVFLYRRHRSAVPKD